jgi:putative transposase
MDRGRRLSGVIGMGTEVLCSLKDGVVHTKLRNLQCVAAISWVYTGMRTPRKIEQGARYHIIARVNRREFILNSKEMKDLFLDVLRCAKGRYDFAVINFCIMGNHVHMIIKPGEKEELSKIMQWILSVFAGAYNRRHKLMGHVWYDRFKSFILANLRRFLETFVYIAENPVKAGIVRRACEFEHNGIWFMHRRMFDIVEPPDDVCNLLIPMIQPLSLPV